MYKFAQDIYFANAPLVRIFAILFSQSPILPEDFANHVGYLAAITQQPEKYLCIYRVIRYSCFEETLLKKSQVVDTSTIYSHGYSIAALVAITCMNKSGQLR